MRRALKWRYGFSIVELLVVLVIVSVVFLGLAVLSNTNIKISSMNSQREEAINTANNVIKFLYLLSYDDNCLSIGNHTCTKICCGIDSANDNLNVAYSVSNGIEENTKLIRVIVEFSMGTHKGKVEVERIKGNW